MATRSDPAVQDLDAEANNDARAAIFAGALARRAVIDWEGVGDAEGNVLTVTPECIDALLSLWPIFEAFNLQYLSRGMLLDAEKNGSAPSQTGTSAEATATARPAAPNAPTAPPD